MKKVLMTILVFGLLSAGNIRAFALPKADLFEIKEGKAILEFENSAVIQDEVKLWLRSITGFTKRTNILEFQNGYCLRISWIFLMISAPF